MCGSEQLCFKLEENLAAISSMKRDCGRRSGEAWCVAVGQRKCRGRLDLSLEYWCWWIPNNGGQL